MLDNAPKTHEKKVQRQFGVRAGTFDASANWITSNALIEAHVRLAGRPEKGENKALEVCCGTGQIGRALVKNGWDVTGIDITAEMVNEANRHFHAICADAQTEMPFMESSFDLCAIRQALFLLEPEKALSHIKRVLKTRGVFILSQTVPFSEKDHEWLRQIHLAKQSALKRFYAAEDIKNELKKNGFTVEETASLRVRESITRWMKEAPELSAEIREKVVDMVRNAPDGYRDERRVEVVNNEVFEDWNWVLFRARTE